MKECLSCHKCVDGLPPPCPYCGGKEFLVKPDRNTGVCHQCGNKITPFCLLPGDVCAYADGYTFHRRCVKPWELGQRSIPVSRLCGGDPIVVVPIYRLDSTLGTKILGVGLGGGLFAPVVEAAVLTAKSQVATTATKGVKRTGTWIVALGEFAVVMKSDPQTDISQMNLADLASVCPNATRMWPDEFAASVSGGALNRLWSIDLRDYGGEDGWLVERDSVKAVFGQFGIPWREND